MAFGDLFAEEDIPISEGIRRLPVYLLLDTSGSMNGTGIDSLNEGLRRFKKESEQEKEARDTIFVCLIEFNSEARMLTDKLVSITDFEPPALVAKGYTKLGDAFKILNESLDNDLIPTIKGEKKGDWTPLIYLLTDGYPYPEHDWHTEREKLIERSKSKKINIITVGCGTGISEENIKSISTGPCFKMSDSGQSFNNFFKWITASAISASKALSKPDLDKKAAFAPPPPPPEMNPLQFSFE